MINMIAVVGKANELGLNNELLWHLPNDLKFFKKTTLNKSVIMGYNTFVSLGRPLPNRTNYVISKTDTMIPGATLITFEEVLSKYEESKEEVFIIGGAFTYGLFLSYADKIYLTEVPQNAEADVYFPTFDKSKYNSCIVESNSDNDISYDHVVYTRKKENK